MQSYADERNIRVYQTRGPLFDLIQW